MSEIWKDIQGYEGLYQVSNTGKIKSFRKYSSGKILKPYITRGYPSIGLCNEKGKKTFLIHRLVASAFVPNPNQYKEVNHIDEDKTNSNADNLEWCSRAYNMAYGNARLHQGISCGNPVSQYTLSNVLIAKYYSAQFASLMTKIDSSSIIACCHGRRSVAGGYKWKYATDFREDTT